MMKKTFQILFLLLLAFLAYFLVDFSDLSLKTVEPDSKTEIQSLETAKTGIKKEQEKININEDNPTEKFFQGNGKEIIELTNKARKEEGAEPLKENSKLNASAMKKAEHMKDNNYFEHISPGGFQPWYFAEKAGYRYKVFGENLAEGYFSAGSVHRGWMESKGHRENILSRKFEEIGVAILEIKKDNQKSYLIVQHFGAPLSKDDMEKKTICEKESRENCEEAEKNEEEIEDLIEKQEEIIDNARDEGLKEDDMEDVLDNLEKLKETEDEIEDYLDECEEFINDCDEWR